MKNISACMSHKSDDWATPSDLYNYYISNGYIDPCPLRSVEDNLERNYENQKLFVNPPFSQLDKWADFVLRNRWFNDIVLLLPSCTDTKYFHKLLEAKPTIVFIKGRLSFNDVGTASFPTMLMIFNKTSLKMPVYISVSYKELFK